MTAPSAPTTGAAFRPCRTSGVYKMPLGMYRSYTPGIDTPITLLWMAKTAYPARFEDIDVTQRAIDYYRGPSSA